MEDFSSTTTSGVDVTGFGMVCPEDRLKIIGLPHTAGHKSYPAYRCPESLCTGVLPSGKLRRLGHIHKMAIAASSAALRASCVQHESQKHIAITVGTGLGALGETARFLENMITKDERQPKPACFVNSVHNSIASQIAMTFGFKAEAHTFTQDSISFDLALWQGINILRLGRADYVLTCGADELSPYVIAFGDRYRWWRTEAIRLSPMSVDKAEPHGTIAGEGAAAFLLRRAEASSETERVARIVTVHVQPLSDAHLKNVDAAQEADFISQAIAKADYTIADVEFFLFGANGNPVLDACYISIERALSAARGRNIRYGVYKQFCGEYCTASAMGLAMALSILREGMRPGIERSKSEGVTEPISNVLLYNLSDARYHSISLVSL